MALDSGISSLNEAESELREIFSGKDFRKAHFLARPALERLAADASLFSALVKRFVLSPAFAESRRINPVLAIPMIETEAFTLVANIWPPRPDGRTDISHQSIHHHGNLLLTSVAAYGPGYESILFECDREQLSRGESAQMAARSVYRNDFGKVEFIDAFVPHIVFYPPALSVTYALWSKDRPFQLGRRGALRVPKALKPALRKALAWLGLAGKLGLNQSDGFDYEVRDGEFRKLVQRAQYQPGTRENFLEALRFVVKEIGLNDPRVNELLGVTEASLPSNLFEPDHLHLKGATLLKAEVLACFR